MPTVHVPDVAITLEQTPCAACGIIFAAPKGFIAARREDLKSFYCPNGHSLGFQGPTESQRLRDELAKQRHLTEQAEALAKSERDMRCEANRVTERVERRLRATKAVVTRTKKKIVAGRCPCCSHKFTDLATHMTTRHPSYDPDKAIAAIEAKTV